MDYRQVHVLAFENVFKDTFKECPLFYVPTFKYIFDRQTSLIINRHFWQVESLIQNNFYNYITTEAITLYEESLQYLMSEELEAELSDSDLIVYDYVKDNRERIIDNLRRLCLNVIFNISHHVYKYVEQARLHGFTFSSIECYFEVHKSTIHVHCYCDTETIRNYDPITYERVSLLI